MGKTKGPYTEEFPVGTIVRIAERDVLESFLEQWKYHHPLEPSQLTFAGAISRVAQVNFYHGADELYELDGIPGTWHEGTLVRA